MPWFTALVHGPSMAPTLRHGDAVLVRRGGRAVRAGDVVVVADTPAEALGRAAAAAALVRIEAQPADQAAKAAAGQL